MKKEKINKEEEVVTGPARQEPSAGGASLAPANSRRLGAPAHGQVRDPIVAPGGLLGVACPTRIVATASFWPSLCYK
jgi:hypothetical protein